MKEIIDHIVSHPGRASITGFTVFGMSMTSLELDLKVALLIISITLGLISLYRTIFKGKKGNDNGSL